jgi:arylsulfatase A-like enzyme
VFESGIDITTTTGIGTVNDIVLVTVDCWRNDALVSMPTLRDATDGWHSRDLLTASAATNGAFPAIMASGYEFYVYDEDGSVRESVRPLPEVLGDAGYATGGFAASNPFLGKWSEYFDEFWNDGMRADGVRESRDSVGRLDKIARFARLEPRVRDEDVIERARNWWDAQSSPRFLWVHLMRPHAPYYPGLGDDRSVGLFRSYLAIIAYARRRGDVPAPVARDIRQLYRNCLVALDTPLASLIETVGSEATTVVTADHGEEFDHGFFDHARLYDETTRCPYLTNDPTLAPDAPSIRQIDLAPTIAALVGADVPEEWGGEPAEYETTPIQPMLTKSELRNRVWAGVRDDDQKLIQTFDWSGELRSEELYDLETDPDEESPVETLPDEDSLRSALSRFIGGEEMTRVLDTHVDAGINGDVASRLEELGYK